MNFGRRVSQVPHIQARFVIRDPAHLVAPELLHPDSNAVDGCPLKPPQEGKKSSLLLIGLKQRAAQHALELPYDMNLHERRIRN
jgi:hypothetical protein